MPRATPCRRQAGQAMLESCIAIMMTGLIFAVVLQMAHLVVAREVLDYSAAAAARAKTVGFNDWMILKVARSAAIPNAGGLLEPVLDTTDPVLQASLDSMATVDFWGWSMTAPASTVQADVELARIPQYLEAPNWMDAAMALDYEDWPTLAVDVNAGLMSGGDGSGFSPMIRAVVSQSYPLRIPLHRAFFDDDTIDLAGEAVIENHYSLYLNDQGM